jgi:hypothetical protein
MLDKVSQGAVAGEIRNVKGIQRERASSAKAFNLVG